MRLYHSTIKPMLFMLSMPILSTFLLIYYNGRSVFIAIKAHHRHFCIGVHLLLISQRSISVVIHSYSFILSAPPHQHHSASGVQPLPQYLEVLSILR